MPEVTQLLKQIQNGEQSMQQIVASGLCRTQATRGG